MNLIITIITLSLLLYHVSCQQCLSLNGSTTCDMFPTAKISIRDPNAVTLPWLVNVSTVADFDRQLLNYVNSTSFWDLELDCSTTIHTIPRYAVSLVCATIVFDNTSSSPCNPPESNTTLPIPLCQSSCDAYSKSVEAILRWSFSDTACNLTTTGPQSLSQQCRSNDGLKGQPSTGCVSAADHETAMCGFSDVETICNYCNNYDSTLSCCAEYNCSIKQLAILSGGAIAGIVIGTVVVLFSCGLLAFCCLIQRKKRLSTYPNNDDYTAGKEMGYINSSSNSKILLPQQHASMVMMTPPLETHRVGRNVYPIEDEDYMEVLPDIHMNLDAESIKGHVFKVNSLEKQFVRVIYPMKSPENPDELELLKNDIIRMYYYFDDGWAFGDNFGSGLRGLFPILCVVNLTPEEVHELLYLSELPDDELSNNDLSNDEGGGGEYYSSIRHFSTGVQYDLDPRATIRLQNLRRTLTFREKSRSPTSSDENNFHYLCAEASSNSSPPLRTASMHATFNPRRSRSLQDPLLAMQQDEDYFRSEASSGSPVVTNNTPDSKTYLNNGY